MIEYRILSGTDEKIVLETHNVAFSDYQVEMQLPLERFHEINILRGVNYNLSIGAFDNSKLIGFTLNGIGKWEGILTAYDCGTGVVKEYRNKGIGDEIFSKLIPVLLRNNITQYLLEVIKSNESAKHLYLKKGFSITRNFDCFMVEREKLEEKLQSIEINAEYQMKELKSLDWSALKEFWETYPSWQNSIDSILRLPEKFRILGAFFEGKIVGYAVVDPGTGGILQIAVDPLKRRKRIGTFLMLTLLKIAGDAKSFHIINVDTSSTSLISFFKFLGYELFAKQHEMSLIF